MKRKSLRIIKSVKTVAKKPSGKLRVKSSGMGLNKSAKNPVKARGKIRIKMADGTKKDDRVGKHMFLSRSNLTPKSTMVAGGGGKSSYMAIRYKKDESDKYKSEDDK